MPVSAPPRCGPFAVRPGCRCGPSAVPIPTNIHEYPRTAPPQPSAFHGCSPVFAAVRGLKEYRGERLELAFQCGFSPTCGGICGDTDRAHARHRADSCQVYAIADRRICLRSTPAGAVGADHLTRFLDKRPVTRYLVTNARRADSSKARHR